MQKTSRIGIIAFILFFSALSFADEIQVPFSVYPKQVQKVFAKYGYKLDLSALDRTKKSWGFLESKGTKYYIYTYQSITKRELEEIGKIIMEN